MDHIERVLFKAGAIAPAFMKKHELFRTLRGRKGLTPPTVKAVPLLESLEAAGRIRHSKSGTAETYQLSAEAANDYKPRVRSTPELVEPSTTSAEDGAEEPNDADTAEEA